ncbi:unnamed protein product [Cuscuta epithymum]|uniref:Uncharacterized protein n=1 Tax=Cuscuta epithymum TaxID=186058 RepID=A0AAV0GDM1_9ASTE|nr:unnamed protein product [Cuscuta epithymum]
MATLNLLWIGHSSTSVIHLHPIAPIPGCKEFLKKSIAQQFLVTSSIVPITGLFLAIEGFSEFYRSTVLGLSLGRSWPVARSLLASRLIVLLAPSRDAA